MNKACFKIREHLLDHHFDELDGLEKQRVDAHLENCDECRDVAARLGNAFTAAADWEPEPKPGEIDRLVDRLAPYLEPSEEKSSGRFLYAVGLALAAGLALFFVMRAAPEPSRFEATPLAVVEPPAPTVVRSKPTEHLRVLSSEDWNGDVATPSSKTTQVKMDRGFAVMAFAGGEGRTLKVVTPDVEIEVIGTRFYVDARPGVPTTVGVVSGKIAVTTERGREVLKAGAERAYQKDGTPKPVQLARSKPYHSDAFLMESAPPAAMIAKSTRAPKRRAKTKLLPRKKPTQTYEPVGRTLEPPPPEVNEADPVAVISEAVRLTREGHFDEAIELIDEALTTAQGKKEPYQAMLRYERARILMKQGKRDEARVELGRLTHAPAKEVSHQAQLSLCELELKDDACTAAACLKTIDSRASRELLKRWQLGQLDCDQDHKTAAPNQLK